MSHIVYMCHHTFVFLDAFAECKEPFRIFQVCSLEKRVHEKRVHLYCAKSRHDKISKRTPGPSLQPKLGIHVNKYRTVLSYPLPLCRCVHKLIRLLYC